MEIFIFIEIHAHTTLMSSQILIHDYKNQNVGWLCSEWLTVAQKNANMYLSIFKMKIAVKKPPHFLLEHKSE